MAFYTTYLDTTQDAGETVNRFSLKIIFIFIFKENTFVSEAWRSRSVSNLILLIVLTEAIPNNKIKIYLSHAEDHGK